MNTSKLQKLTNEEYEKLSSYDQSNYDAGWKSRANRERFEVDKSWYWKRGWKDADNDPALRSEEMMK